LIKFAKKICCATSKKSTRMYPVTKYPVTKLPLPKLFPLPLPFPPPLSISFFYGAQKAWWAFAVDVLSISHAVVPPSFLLLSPTPNGT
jgi:hypothetical protein